MNLSYIGWHVPRSNISLSATHERLVELIYDSAEGTSAWTDVISALASELSADLGHLFLIAGDATFTDTCVHGYDLSLNAPYFERFQAEDPRITLGIKNLGRFMSDVDVIDSRQFEASALYNEHLGPGNIRYTLFGMHQIQPDLKAAQAFMRPRSRGPFSNEEVSCLQRLQPHLSRALRLREILNKTRDHASDLRSALDMVPLPLAVVDDKGRFLTANAPAEAMLLEGPAVVLKGQRIAGTRPRDTSAIAQAVAACCQLATPSTLRPAALQPPPVVTIERLDRRPLSLIFLPLRPRHTLRDVADRKARVVVIFHDPEAGARLSSNVVARLHGLTPSEARLAVALAAGDSLTQHAANVGCTDQTCRTHLKHILEKTGTHRQAELVHLLLGNVAIQMASGAVDATDGPPSKTEQ